MNNDILIKINDKYNDFINNNSNRILENIFNSKVDASPSEMFSSLANYLLCESINEKTAKPAYEISQEIKNNKIISKAFKEMGSAHSNGAILVGIGISLMNLDRYADGVINESISNYEFSEKDLKLVEELNIKNLSKETLDRMETYFKNTTNKDFPGKTKTNKCNCSNCSCNSSKKAKSTEAWAETLVKQILTKQILDSVKNVEAINMNDLKSEDENDFVLLKILTK